MEAIQKAVTAYLQRATGVPTVAERTRVVDRYPLLAVAVNSEGTVLVDGGRQAEHSYRVTVTAAADRQREGNTALLGKVAACLLRGVPMVLPTETGGRGPVRRVLHPLEVKTEGEALTFSVELCVPVPPEEQGTVPEAELMGELELGL